MANWARDGQCTAKIIIIDLKDVPAPDVNTNDRA
jgi:hypothetical protein